MKLSTKIFIIAIIVLSIGISVLGYLYKEIRAEAKRQTSNVENLLKDKNQELELTRGEYKDAQTAWKHKTDSLLKVIGITTRSVNEITLINSKYKDSLNQMALMGNPEEIAEPVKPTPYLSYLSPINFKPAQKLYRIPASLSTPCWGMKSEIISHDPLSYLNILEKTADNNQQLVGTRTRLWGFLWWKKDNTYNLYSDCGVSTFTKIKFVKK